MPDTHDRWEYKTIWGHGFGGKSLRDAEGTDYGLLEFEQLDELLNGLGRDGWEVCGVTCSSICPFAVVLKRRIAPA